MTYLRAGFGLLFALLILTFPLSALAQVASSTIATSTLQIATTTVTTATSTPDVATTVAAYFADIPVMAAIAKCESDDREFNTDGAVLNGGSGGMIGVFQINGAVHAAFALTMGDDIDTLAGNMAYARYLYNTQGTTPWDSSKSCWGSVALPAAASSTLALTTPAVIATPVTTTTTSVALTAPAKTSTNTSALSINLKLGTVSPQVATLQKLLNSAGFFVAKSGTGSVGHESTKFGAATLAAVERFQCVQNIVCKGTVATTGYGYVGAKTRAALMLNS